MYFLFIRIASIFMNILYFFIKLFPTQNKVTFISRQGNKNSLDFSLVQEKLKKMDKNVKIVALNKRFRDIDPMMDKIKYCFHILVQMYHIATSKVVVLETYCLPISMLKHKKSLKVIQMWHALGSLKKFGYSSVDKKEGSNLSGIAKMHRNYDCILTSSEVSLKNFAEAFGYEEKYLKVIPLPRVDYLMDKENEKRITKKIKKEYKVLNDKKNIVYAPTFRKNKDDIQKIEELVNSIDYSKYNLILKLHPLTKVELDDSKAILDTKFPTIDWLFVADYVITDYSAIVYEASLLKKSLFFYVYDFKEYENGRDFYLDYKKEMPGFISGKASNIIKAIEEEKQDQKKIDTFNKKYIDYHNQDCTLEFVKLILEMKEA